MYSNRRFSTKLWLFACFWTIIILASCSVSPTQSTSSTSQPIKKSTQLPVLGASHCQPPSPISTTKFGMPEVQGTANGKTELWALLFEDMVAKQELKIVWRMTGTGDMQIVANGPRGESVKAKWITYHGSSSWARPGLEWGTGFILPEAGCWNFSARRGSDSGEVWLLVK